MWLVQIKSGPERKGFKNFKKYTNIPGVSFSIKRTDYVRMNGSPCTFEFMFEQRTMELKS